MKKMLCLVFLMIAFNNSFAQKKPSGYDSSIAGVFDLLHNKPFAALSMEDTSGNLINTSSFGGKTIYVDFWFTTCPPCIKEIPFSKSLCRFFAADTEQVLPMVGKLKNRPPGNRSSIEKLLMKITTKSQIANVQPEPKPNSELLPIAPTSSPTIGNTFVRRIP